MERELGGWGEPERWERSLEMCGRFTLTTADYVSVAKALDADFNSALLRYFFT